MKFKFSRFSLQIEDDFFLIPSHKWLLVSWHVFRILDIHIGHRSCSLTKLVGFLALLVNIVGWMVFGMIVTTFWLLWDIGPWFVYFLEDCSKFGLFD